MGELAEFLAMDATTLTAAAKTLEKRGLLTLLPDESDARARRPGLTDQGREIIAQAVPLWREEHAKVEAELLGQDAGELAKILSQLG